MPAARLLIQFPATLPAKAAGDDPSVGVPATQEGDSDWLLLSA